MIVLVELSNLLQIQIYDSHLDCYFELMMLMLLRLLERLILELKYEQLCIFEQTISFMGTVTLAFSIMCVLLFLTITHLNLFDKNR